MPVTTSLDKFRLELGDTPAAHGLAPPRPVPDPEFQALALLNDDEAQHFIGSHPSSVLLAVAAACDALAARFAQDVDTAEDGQSFKDSQKAERYMKMAATFRKRAATDVVVGSTVVPGAPIGRVPAREATTWSSRF